jgi:hypothetical protein
MGRQNIFPANILLRQKPVGRLRFSPAVACMRNAGRRLVCQPIQQRNGTLLNRASPKSIPASAFSAHAWLIAASIEIMGPARENLVVCNEVR